jgi:hypothetical protein
MASIHALKEANISKTEKERKILDKAKNVTQCE